jgi:hypothetical protein
LSLVIYSLSQVIYSLSLVIYSLSQVIYSLSLVMYSLSLVSYTLSQVIYCLSHEIYSLSHVIFSLYSNGIFHLDHDLIFIASSSSQPIKARVKLMWWEWLTFFNYNLSTNCFSHRQPKIPFILRWDVLEETNWGWM